MRIYTVGCSFTFGDELADPYNSAWPALLAKKMNASVFNDGTSGGSNSRIVYRTIKNLSKDFDLYIIAWTTNTRFTFYKSDSNEEIHFNPHLVHQKYEKETYYRDWGKTLYSVWFNELYAFKLWLQQIIQLQSVIKKPYLMVNTFDNYLEAWLSDKNAFIASTGPFIDIDLMGRDQIMKEYEEIQYYNSLINKNTFYKWNEFSMHQLCHQFECGPHGHFLEEGHTYMSDLIYNHLTK
jgi:hypothetical protein